MDQQNQDGNTPLLIAAYKGHLEIAKWLIDHGAAVDQQNQDGNTPLGLAAYEGHQVIVSLLLASLPDPSGP